VQPEAGPVAGDDRSDPLADRPLNGRELCAEVADPRPDGVVDDGVGVERPLARGAAEVVAQALGLGVNHTDLGDVRPGADVAGGERSPRVLLAFTERGDALGGPRGGVVEDGALGRLVPGRVEALFDAFEAERRLEVVVTGVEESVTEAFGDWNPAACASVRRRTRVVRLGDADDRVVSRFDGRRDGPPPAARVTAALATTRRSAATRGGRET